jgi:toxin ParE1/3/4
MRYRITPQAEQDLDEIYVYWAKRASPETANRLIDSIVDRFWLLGEHPDAGRKSEEVAAGVKCFPAGKYLIYCRATRRGTDILYVFHGARDLGRALRVTKKRE